MEELLKQMVMTDASNGSSFAWSINDLQLQLDRLTRSKCEEADVVLYLVNDKLHRK
ncbi:hypothetical protein Dimus_001685, partial [Dionaea muscipula]